MLDFPASPTNGQQFPAPNGVTYQWQATPGLWVTAASAPSAPIDSPVFTGDPQAPSPLPGDDDQSVPTTSWVNDEIDAAVGAIADPAWGDITGKPDFDATYVNVAGDTMIGALVGTSAAFTDQITSTTSLTGASTPALNISQTWDNAATSFLAFDMNVVDNASNASSYLAVWKANSSNRFTFNKAGAFVAVSHITAGASAQYTWSARSSMTAPADGQIRLANSAQTDFSRLQFGGTTASFPAIKRNLTAINFRLADDSADAPITAGSVTAMAGTTVAAGANTQAFIKASSTANLGLYYGSGAPAFSAAKGSLYTNTTATTTTTRLYVNTDGGTTWANFTASA